MGENLNFTGLSVPSELNDPEIDLSLSDFAHLDHNYVSTQNTAAENIANEESIETSTQRDNAEPLNDPEEEALYPLNEDFESKSVCNAIFRD